MRILHLSDLHFRADITQQDLVLESLKAQIQKMCNNGMIFNILVITGDIAFSGKKEEYELAMPFFKWLLSITKVKPTNIFFIPGNHDVDRKLIEKKQIRWWYSFANEDELFENLSSSDCFSSLRKKTEAYEEFAKSFMTSVNAVPGKFGEFVYEASLDIEARYQVKIVGLNSALFCGYDGDDQERLAVGLEQVQTCLNAISPENQLIISLIHHPFRCFHLCDKPSLNTLKRMSDIVLSGHVHEVAVASTDDGNTRTVFLTTGAAYEKRTVENSFNVIEVDCDTMQGKVSFYKYVPTEHKWIQDKNQIEENEGQFLFKIPKDQLRSSSDSEYNNKPPVAVAEKSETQSTNTYLAVINLEFNELNRRKIEALTAHIKSLSSDMDISITKIESGSVKIYFESNGEIPDELLQHLKSLSEWEVLSVSKDTQKSAKPSKVDPSVYHWKTFVRPDFFSNIQNPGAAFTHSRVDSLSLKDLYVSPNLKKVSFEKENDNQFKVINAEEVFAKTLGKPIKIVLYGPDYSGKSTIVKWWYDNYYEKGYLPILISGNRVKEISLNRLRRLIENEFKKQYSIPDGCSITDYEQDRLIIFIDDFHKIRFNNAKYKSNLISNLSRSFNNIILTGNELMQMETFTSKSLGGANSFEKFDKYTIVEFGPRLRYELIRKWNELGKDQLSANELIRLNNETEQYVETIIGKNFVPSYPVFLLTILQAREVTSTVKPEFSLHGFYYELLINDALNRAVRVKTDISLFYNYITEYCYYLFNTRIRLEPISIRSFEQFHANYCDIYKVNIPQNYVVETLLRSKLIDLRNGELVIGYRYVYYFFVARYLANNIAQQEIRDLIQALCQRIHRDEFASIIMFLTHLSKDGFIIDQLLENSRSLFQETIPAKLETDVLFIDNMVKSLPDQVYRPIRIEDIKSEELRDEELLEEQEKEFEESGQAFEYDIDEDVSSLDVLSKLVKAIKTIEILGQLTKKYWGEIKGPTKFDLVQETYMLGLRALGYYYKILQNDTDVLIHYLHQIYRKNNARRNYTKEEIDLISAQFLFGLSSMAAFGIIKRVTNAVGFEKLSGTYAEVLQKNQNIAVHLIDTSIKLDHNTNFPWEEIKFLREATEKQMLAKAVLKNLVINYLYIFHTSIEEKQRICAFLDIKIDKQLLIDATSQVKKE